MLREEPIIVSREALVHTSSIALLDGPPGAALDETCLRDRASADDYYRKIVIDLAGAKSVAN